MRILIIEDEPQLARHVNAALVRHGHTASILGDGSAGLQAALTVPPDLVVLDVNLPTMNGFEVLARLRSAKSTARVLMLTSRGEVGDRIKGLNAGADDYIPKPFAMDELVARVEALGRRVGGATLTGSLQVADLHMNVALRRVLRAGQPILLSPREFDLLQVLMQEPGRFFDRTELYDRVWQVEHRYDSRTVEMFITRLRKKIDADFPVPLIHTQRNVGYTVRSPVAEATLP